MELNKLIKRPVLRYHGGKFLLAKWIVSNFPEHRVYVEPFGGAGSVLMRKERSYAEVYNDVWDTVVNVFTLLRDPDLAAQLERLLYLTPFSRTDFDLPVLSEDSALEKARKTILRSFAGFGSSATNGKYPTGFRSNSNKSRTIPAQDWAGFNKHISSFTERLQGVVIENRVYKKVCLTHDSLETLFYFDPPYKHSTRNMRRGNAVYAYEMNDAAHVEFTEFVQTLKGKVIISGYANDLYDTAFNNWAREEREALADGARKRTEVLWLSPNCDPFY